MVKKLLFCASILVGLCFADVCAQNISKPEILRQTIRQNAKHETVCLEGTPNKAKAKANVIAKSRLNLNDNEVWWGYFDGTYRGNDPFDYLKTGFSGPITYACGIRLCVNNDWDMGKGKTIEGIKFAFCDIKNIEDVKIWMSTTLPKAKDMSDCDICVQNVKKSDLIQVHGSPANDYVNEIRFDKPYTITDKDVYVGYVFHVKDVDDVYDQAPVVLEKYPEHILSTDGAFLWRYDDDTEWMEEDNGRVIAMQVLFSCNNFKNNAVNVSDSFKDVALAKNSTANVPITLTSIGKEGLTSFKYQVTSNGNVTDEQTVTLSQPVKTVGGKYVYEFPVKSADKNGVYDTKIKITEVNGKANEGLYQEAKGDAVVVENVPVRKVFIEDYTAIWGRGAAFGFVNKEKLKELYNDKVAVVSVHNGSTDPMTEKAYDDYTYANDILSIPTTYLDRTFRDVYPYFGTDEGLVLYYGYADFVEKALAQVSVATVDVKGQLSEDGSQVEVEADVKFAFTGEKNNYALLYILTEDGMQDESWVQKNGLPQYAGFGLEVEEPLFDLYINGETEMTGLVYDDVVVATKGLVKGIEGTISKSIRLGEVQTDKQVFTLSRYPIIQDKTKLNAFAVLIDTNSGKVINANKCKVMSGTETAIDICNNDSITMEMERYSIDGRKLQRPAKGINIVKYSNGKVVKQIIK